MTRSLLLRVLLLAVAGSALLGVVAIFAQSALSGQLVGSAITCAFACALIVPVTPREPGDRVDSIAVIYMSYIGVSAALVLLLIWNSTLFGSLDSIVALWFFVGVPAMLLVVGALRSRLAAKPPLRASEDIAAWGVAGTLGFTMVLHAAAPGTLSSEGEIAFGYILIAAVLVASLAATALRPRAKHPLSGTPDPPPIERRLAWLAFALTLLAAIASFTAIESGAGLSRGGSPWLTAMLLATFAVPIAIWNYFGLAHADLKLFAMRVTATATTFVAGGCATYAGWLDYGSTGAEIDLAVRAALAAMIVAIASTLAGLVTLRMARMRAALAGPITFIDWKCPRCKTPAGGPPGELRCQRCGLTAIIGFRDDLCPDCGYDLHAMRDASKNCPECGRERQMPAVAGSTTSA